jgi:Resolvase, N terminal domain
MPSTRPDAIELGGQGLGSTRPLPGLERALGELRTDDTLVVWRLDRLGRSVRHLVDTKTGSSTTRFSSIGICDCVQHLEVPSIRVGCIDLEVGVWWVERHGHLRHR